MYTIKPLKWNPTNRQEGANVVVMTAHTAFGNFDIIETGGALMWWFSGGVGNDCTSVEDGKAKAESHWHSRMLTGLEPENNDG